MDTENYFSTVRKQQCQLLLRSNNARALALGRELGEVETVGNQQALAVTNGHLLLWVFIARSAQTQLLPVFNCPRESENADF